MNTKNHIMYVGITLLVVLLFVAVDTALSQKPYPEMGESVTPVAALPEVEDVLALETQEDSAFGEPQVILSQPPYTMNYQGYLTDSSGNPLDGSYNLSFELWNAESGGDLVWGPESHNNVQVTNGIFQVALGSSDSLLPNTFKEALFLAVGVNSAAVTPRQPLRAVPYAFGLVPGAEVEGDPEGLEDYGLTVHNTGTGVGILAKGPQGLSAIGINHHGLKATTISGKYAIYSDGLTYSAEGYAGQDTYVWVPVHNAVIDFTDANDDVRLENQNYGELRVEAGPGVHTATTLYVLIPIQVEVPYGREYLLKNARVYYKVDSYAQVELARIRGRDFSTGEALEIGEDLIDRRSSTFSYFTIEATDNNTITTSQAPTTLELLIDLPYSDSTFYLYGIQLQLESDY